MEKKKRNNVIVMTLVSAFFFCVLVVITSLSPLADLGPNANQFGSQGMWLSIGFILLCYILPLGIYMLGVDMMRYIMAILCGLGVFMNLSFIVVVIVISVFVEAIFPASFGVVGVNIAGSIVNFIWFFVAFRSPQALKKA